MSDTGDDPRAYDPHDHDPGEDAGMFWRVTPGGAAELVAAYRAAVRQADDLAAALAAAGLTDQVTVTAGLDPAGQPLVCGTITLAGARRLAEFLAAGGRDSAWLDCHGLGGGVAGAA